MKSVLLAISIVSTTFAGNLACPDVELNPALQKSKFFLCQLAWPGLSSAERVQYQQEYWNLLAETGPETASYGSIVGGPISNVNPAEIVTVTSGAIVAPTATAWAYPGHYIPTNDWIENIGVYPNAGSDSDNGFHRIVVAPDGFNFYMAMQYYDWGVALHSMIQVNGWDAGFKLGAVGYTKPFTFNWNNQTTGNLVRQAYYDSGFSVFISQGGLFQGASYVNTVPDVGFTLQSSMKTVLSNGVIKYKVTNSTATYLIYGNATFVPGMPYTGYLNVTGIPNTSNEAALESLCDQHANAVIVQAQGTLLPDGTYSFQYLSTDLTGVPTALPPLVLLKAHHVNSLLPLQSVPDTGLSLMCLTGPVEIYAGSTFVFQPKAPRSLDPAPNLPNGGAPLTQAQAQALCAANGPLAQAIAYILANYGPTYTVYTGGKVDYQIALTLHYGVKALQIAGLPLTTIMPLYQRLRQRMAGRPPFYQYETQYGGIIAAGDDYGNHSDYNDHIVQYGYDVMSFSILKVFEDANFPQSQGLLGQTIPLTGYGALTYAQMVDLIAADMGELSRTNPYLPVMRNLDVYIGHSWLSGLGEKNTESQSEVVLGSWATAYWLSVSGAPQDQLGTALTRFALETESLNTYNYIGTPANSVFNTIAPAFTSSHNVVSITWGNGKLGDETYWGLNWDRIFACEFMPASANTMDTMLDNVPVFAQNGADYILANWSNFDTGNTIQSVLIPIVSKVYGATQGAALIANVAAENNFFDNGTNAFILSYINYYADNQLHQ